jgi:hypothetical protein
MSKIALTPNSSGTGTFTLAAPDSDTNRTITLPDEAGELLVNTATGIDVSGTVASDGLTVEGSDFILGTFERTSPTGGVGVELKNGDNNSWQIVNGGDEVYTLRYTPSGGSAVKYFEASSGGDISFYEDTGTTAKFFWDASAEALALGTTTSVSNNRLVIDQASGDGQNSGFYMQRNGGAGTSLKIDIDSSDVVNIRRSATTALAIDSSGNLLVGKSSDNNALEGISLAATGAIKATNSSDLTGIFNRLTTDGDIVQFWKDGTTVGSIGSIGGADLSIEGADGVLYIGGNGGGSLRAINNLGSGTARLEPTVDNTTDLGFTSKRYDDVYATNGTIQTSDRNEKQDIAALTATEMLVAARISGLFKTFRWIDSVADKGDNARTHTGVIAQDVQAAFTAEGLDAGDYALFTSATWWETQTEVPAVDAVEAVDATYDDDGNELTAAVEAVEAADAYTRTDTYNTLDEAPDGATERTRMGIRYPELLAFVGAYNEQRFASIETRLAALEAV